MVRTFKWMVPALAVLGLMFAVSTSTTKAADEKPAASGGTVSGTVVDASGKGVDGAMVRVMKPREKGAGKNAAPKADAPGGAKGKGERPPAVAEGTTDKDGKFSLTNVPPGDYTVIAMAKGVGMGRGQVSVKAGETATVALTLQERKPGGGAGGGGKKPEAK